MYQSRSRNSVSKDKSDPFAILTHIKHMKSHNIVTDEPFAKTFFIRPKQTTTTTRVLNSPGALESRE
jgi:hypothetical protein